MCSTNPPGPYNNDVDWFHDDAIISKMRRPTNFTRCRHASLWKRGVASVFCVIFGTSVGSSVAQTPEVRGTWLTTTGLAAGNLSSPAVTAQTYQRLRTIGLNTTYVDVWRNGATYFPSNTLARITGRTLASEVGTRDLYGETVIQAHRQGMANVAWFQYGLAAKFGNPGTSSTELAKYAADRGWLLQDSTGAYTNTSNGFAWMNPIVPEVRRLLIDMTIEAIDKYDLDGVQLDDRLAWPTQFGYDNTTRAAYLAETGNQVPASSSNAAFTAWRAAKVTAFAQEFYNEVKARRPSIIVSVSPSVWSFSYANYAADWPEWSRQGLFDEFIPQVYRNTFNNFSTTWNTQVTQIGTRRGDLVAGVAINTTGTTYDIVRQSIDRVRQTSGVAGHSIWFSEGIFANEASFDGYYPNNVERPDLPAGWRPLPTVATALGGGQWSLSVPATGRYRLIARSGDVWTQIWSDVLAAGAFNLSLSGYSSVELLVDRRGWRVGDANFDGKVDLFDYFALSQSFNLSGRRFSQGDFNLDGLVNALDFELLASSFDDPQLRSSVSIPEPGTLLSLGAIGLLCLRRNRN